jgi:hypothetical protein
MEKTDKINDEVAKKEKREASAGAHARFRKGTTDYFDEGNLSHYGGNDDYPGNNDPQVASADERARLNGKEAAGNDLTQEELEALEDNADYPPTDHDKH